MRITGKLFLAAVIAVTVSTAGFAQETTPTIAVTKDTVVATVNGTDITLGHVLSLSSHLPDKYANVPDKDLYAGILDQLVQQELLSATITKISPELKLASENEHRALFATEAIQGIYKDTVTDAAVKAKYSADYVNAEPKLEYKTSHILVKTEDEAKAIIKQLEAGADFAKLAKEKSTGPSGAQGGDLGWVGLGALVPAFEAEMIKLKPNEVSAPVKTQFGWHVIKLAETRVQPVPSLDQVRSKIEDELRADAFEKTLAKLEASGKVKRTDQEIDPSVVRKFDLLKD
jgi:peptidyl-prolyl cis-trans isomerase C